MCKGYSRKLLDGPCLSGRPEIEGHAGTMIRKLPQALINKIAAGEVVERPASVVKELVENALDAGSTSIAVMLWGNAVGGIEVVDDGSGMDEADAAVCLEHHATSKLAGEEDLARIGTLGFRGEALSSIAAVSRLTLITRREGRDAGVKVKAEGGVIGPPEPSAAAKGTRIRVEDLFFNVPARLKFLKSIRTEEALAAETVRHLALTSPSVGMRYIKDGREAFTLAPSDEAGRVGDVLHGRSLYSVAAEGGAMRLRAYLTPPERAKRGASNLILIVNGRCVADRAVAGAVAAAHEGLLEKGTYPEGVIVLELPPEEVDVNVHPQKREIRFASAQAVFGFIRKHLGEALKSTPWLKEAPPPIAAIRADTEAKSGASAAEQRSFYGRAPLPSPLTPVRPAFAAEAAPPVEPGPASPTGFFSSSEAVARLFSTYILCERGDQLLIIDQHAAAERITFERLRRQVREGKVHVQALLLPAVVPMEEKEVAAVEENEGILRAIGVDAGPSGPDCVTVRALPALLGNVDPAALMRELVEAVLSTRGRTEEVVESVLQRMACHGSVRAGRSLSSEEIQALLRQLDTVDFSTHCPHGRPVYFALSRKEIETRLKRS
jgi:DNA mismatch repair protein MutL